MKFYVLAAFACLAVGVIIGVGYLWAVNLR